MSILLKNLLNELKLVDLSDKSQTDKKYIFYYKDKLFIFDENSDTSSIIDYLKHHPNYKNILKFKGDSAWNLISILNDYILGSITGQWYVNDKSLYIIGINDIDVKSSPYVKKIADFLKVKNVEISNSDDNNIKVSRKNLKGNFPSIMYHGTSTSVLINILRKGIHPRSFSRSDTNWKNVEHWDLIFLAVSKETAFQYADTATRSKDKQGHPVVIEVTIPDPALIIPDLDADPERKTSQYAGIMKDKFQTITNKPITMSKHAGKIGYEGNIKPKFIRWLWFNIEGKVKKISPAKFIRLYNRYDDEVYYYLGITQYGRR